MTIPFDHLELTMPVITLENLNQVAENIATRLRNAYGDKYFHKKFKIYGIPRGGLFCALILANKLPGSVVIDDPSDADIIVDDIEDSGRTLARYRKENALAITTTFFNSKDFSEWVTFPWEVMDKTGGMDDVVIRVCQKAGPSKTNKEHLAYAGTFINMLGAYFSAPY